MHGGAHGDGKLALTLSGAGTLKWRGASVGTSFLPSGTAAVNKIPSRAAFMFIKTWSIYTCSGSVFYLRTHTHTHVHTLRN